MLAADAITTLATLPGQSVHAVITSPPYFGLRDYGLEPLVWASVEYAPMAGLAPIRVPAGANPEGFASCRHEWERWTEHHEVREETIAGKTRTSQRFHLDPSRRFQGAHHQHRHGQFCTQCGAWHGCLGLEPTVDLYIGHLVQVFRAVHRVLRDDGTCWLNLGDRYAQTRTGGIKHKDLAAVPWRAALALQTDGWYLRSDVVWAKGVSFAPDGSSGNTMPESVTDRPVRGHEFAFLLAKSERYFYDHFAVQKEAIIKP